ncbi:MAG: HAMP domain-containing protein [Candidatus Omnitrophica bacterium]|nr:HAMP domain-containing protein [Candidatus Omnitrophota bacterium]MBU1996748.1 HAMP domain-containing protein [Candidatus Omnitrophota bacterium]
MKISNKISVFILFLLTVLGCNTIIGLTQLSKIGFELRNVVKRDMALTEVVTSINNHQHKKVILFERVLRIAEEVAFENVTDIRKRYLLEHIELLKEGFNKIGKQAASNIIDGKEMIEEEFINTSSDQKKVELDNARLIIKKVEESLISYDAVISKIFGMIEKTEYQLSFEDIDEIKRNEKRLSLKLEAMLVEIKEFSKRSLAIANQEEKVARKVLWVSFVLSIVISSIISFALIRSIARPLKRLVNVAQQVGKGKFEVEIDDIPQDEIGEVSTAFVTMGGKLAEFTDKLEEKRIMLLESLEITEGQKQDLQKVNKELDSFVHTVSHDLRAPLTGISGYAAYLEKHYKGKLDDKAIGCIAGIRRSVTRLNNLIEDLLILTRISRIKNPYEKVDISQIIVEICERLEFDIEKYNVEMVISEELPTIICDRIKISEAFLNLVNNAIKFSTKNNDSRPKLTIDHIEHEKFYEFIVSDNGIGIAKENQEKVFEIFSRLHTTQEYVGSGAGLSIVKAVIDSHGGTIWIDSEVGKGAAFHFTIPKGLSLEAIL